MISHKYQDTISIPTKPVEKMFIRNKQVKNCLYSAIKLNTKTLLTEKFKEAEASTPLNKKDVTKYLKSLYENDPVKLNKNISRANFDPFYSQLVKLQSQLNNCGLNNLNITKYIQQTEYIDHNKLNILKTTAEAIVYNIYKKGVQNIPIKVYKHVELQCIPGAITNLQNILKELTIDSNIYTKIANIKSMVIDQSLRGIAVNLFNTNNKKEEGNEIHIISSMRNLVSDEYHLTKKSSAEDGFLKKITNNKVQAIFVQLAKNFQANNQNNLSFIIESITEYIENNVPKEDLKALTEEFPGWLKKFLDLDDSNDLITPYTLADINPKTYEVKGLKSNYTEIIKDIVIQNLQEKGLLLDLKLPEISLLSKLNLTEDAALSKLNYFNIIFLKINVLFHQLSSNSYIDSATQWYLHKILDDLTGNYTINFRDQLHFENTNKLTQNDLASIGLSLDIIEQARKTIEETKKDFEQHIITATSKDYIPPLGHVKDLDRVLNNIHKIYTTQKNRYDELEGPYIAKINYDINTNDYANLNKNDEYKKHEQGSDSTLLGKRTLPLNEVNNKQHKHQKIEEDQIIEADQIIGAIDEYMENAQ